MTDDEIMGARSQGGAEYFLNTTPADASDRELRVRAQLAGEDYAKRMAASSLFEERWKKARAIADTQDAAVPGESKEAEEVRKTAAFKLMQECLLDVEKRGLPVGRHDPIGSMWKQGGFASGAEAYAFVSNLVRHGPEAVLTDDFKEFRNLDYAGQVELARSKRGRWEDFKSAAGDAASSVWNRFEQPVLSDAELVGASEDVVRANELLKSRDARRSRSDFDGNRMQIVPSVPVYTGMDELDEEARKADGIVAGYRAKMEDERIRSQYEAELLRKNAWIGVTHLMPTMSDAARECAQAIIDSSGTALPMDKAALFSGLSEDEQNKVISIRKLLKPQVEEGILNTLEDAAIGLANTTIGIVAAPYRLGTKIGNMFANAAFDAGIDVNEIQRRKQALWEATGNFAAGGDLESASLPSLQFEQVCENHGVLGSALIGAVSTLGYMYSAGIRGASLVSKAERVAATGRALADKGGRLAGLGSQLERKGERIAGFLEKNAVGKGVGVIYSGATSGTTLVALEGMNQFDEHMVAEGGDITDPGYILQSFVMGGLYAYVERLQLEKLLGEVGDIKLRESLLKGVYAGFKDGTVPKVLFATTLNESVEEGLQNGIMAIHEALALDKDVPKAFVEGFIEDFVGSLGTMAVVGAGGIVVGHAARSGFRAGEEGRKNRSRDLTQLVGERAALQAIVRSNNMSDGNLVDSTLAAIKDHYREWRRGGRKALEKAGLSQGMIGELEGVFELIRSDESTRARAREAFKTRAGEAGANDVQELSEAYERMLNGDIEESSFLDLLKVYGFDDAGAQAYLEGARNSYAVTEAINNIIPKMIPVVREDYAREQAGYSDQERLEDVRRSLEDIDSVRSSWARGHGMLGGEGVADPGVAALMQRGFTEEDAKRLSALFQQERANFHSGAAIEGMRTLYERATRGQVTPVAALAEVMGGRVENIDGADYIRFTNGLVRIVDGGDGSIDPNDGSEEAATSVEEATKNAPVPVTAAQWRAAPPEQRSEWIRLNGLRDQGGFSLVGNYGATVDAKGADAIIGTIRVVSQTDADAVEDGLAPLPGDTGTVFHELFHGWSRFMQLSGAWSEEDVANLVKRYGAARTSDELFNEEAAADAFRDYIKRRTAGALTEADENDGVFRKLVHIARGVKNAAGAKKAVDRVAANAEEAFYDQIIADKFSGVGDLTGEKPKPEAKPTEAKTDPAAPQMPGRKDGSAAGATEAKPQNPEEGKPDGKKPEVAESAPKPGPSKMAAGWSATTPLGEAKVGGRYMILKLSDVIHSNDPRYAVHKELQPRNRKDNKKEEEKRNNILNNLDASRFFDGKDTANGEPIVALLPSGEKDADGKDILRAYVISGNGRVLILNQLLEKHMFDKYRNELKAWCERNGVELDLSDGEERILVRVLDDLGGKSLKKIAKLSNADAITRMTESEYASIDAETIVENNLAPLYVPNRNGTPNMTPGVNDNFFRLFSQLAEDGDDIYDEGNGITENGKGRIVRAMIHIACGQGDRGKAVVRKIIKDADTLDIVRQKNAVQFMAPAIADLEGNPSYQIGPDVSRAMADFIDYVERKRAGKIGTFEEFLGEADMFDPRSEIAEEILKLLAGSRSAESIAAYAKKYCEVAKLSDADGSLNGSENARTRIQVWRDAAKAVEESGEADRKPAERRSFTAHTVSDASLDFRAANAYYEGDVRDIVYGIKRKDEESLEIAAATLARYVRQGDVLVPVPGHLGRAEDTLALAEAISRITGTPVANILRGTPRDRMYDLKKNGVLPSAETLGMMRVTEPPEGRRIVLLDNVVGTGTTAYAAREAAGGGSLLAFAWDVNAPRPDGIRGGLVERRSIRAEITADVGTATLASAKESLKAISGRILHNDSTGIDAEIRRTQVKKILSSKAIEKSKANGFTGKDHLAAASIIDRLWKNAELVETAPDRNGDRNIKSIKRFAAIVYLGGEEAVAYLTAKETDKHHVYSLEIQEIKKLEDDLKGRDPLSSSDGEILAKLRAKVNEDGEQRYSFAIGRTGAANLRDALFINGGLNQARDMLAGRDWESLAKDEKERINLATGWEVGADGKWRYEIADLPEIDLKRLSDPNPLYDPQLDDYGAVKNPEKAAKYMPVKLGEIWPKKAAKAVKLFEAYPWLKEIPVTYGARMGYFTRGAFNPVKWTIGLNANLLQDAVAVRETLTHEVQHAIQEVEDFARGGSGNAAAKVMADRFRKAHREANDFYKRIEDRLGDGIEDNRNYRIWKSHRDRWVAYRANSPEVKAATAFLESKPWWKDVKAEERAFRRQWGHGPKYFWEGDTYSYLRSLDIGQAYRSLAGEVEARNAARRIGRPVGASLFSETEDVARESQILINEKVEEFMRSGASSEQRHLFASLRGGHALGISPSDAAVAMEKRGEDPYDIWRETGWWRAADGKWRVTLPWSGAFNRKGGPLLKDYFDWPELFKAYPKLEETRVVLQGEDDMLGAWGEWDAEENAIFVLDTVANGGASLQDFAGLFIHEIQHAIQEIELLAPGGSPSLFNADPNADEKYLRLAGEVEARNAATRMFMPVDQLQTVAPWMTEDYGYDSQIVLQPERLSVTAMRSAPVLDNYIDVADFAKTHIFTGNADDRLPENRFRTDGSAVPFDRFCDLDYVTSVWVVPLNAGKRPMSNPIPVFKGQAMHPREMFKDALRWGAKSIAVIRTQPFASTPYETTGREKRDYEWIREAGEMLGVDVASWTILRPDGAARPFGSEDFKDMGELRDPPFERTFADVTDGKERYSITADRRKNLIAVHGLSAKGLRKAVKAGGLVMPSAAIVDAGDGWNVPGYADTYAVDSGADIFLMFPKGVIDQDNVDYFTGDAFTPTVKKLVDMGLVSDDGSIEDIRRLQTAIADFRKYFNEARAANIERDRGRDSGNLMSAIQIPTYDQERIRKALNTEERLHGYKDDYFEWVERSEAEKGNLYNEIFASVGDDVPADKAVARAALAVQNATSASDIRAALEKQGIFRPESIESLADTLWERYGGEESLRYVRMVEAKFWGIQPVSSANGAIVSGEDEKEIAEAVELLRAQGVQDVRIFRKTPGRRSLSQMRADRDRLRDLQGEMAERFSIRAWPQDFPKVTVMTTRKYIEDHYAEDFAKAKAGNLPAAQKIVEAVAGREECISKLKQLAATYPDATLVPVVAVERTGKNVLPYMYAQFIREKTGLRLAQNILMTDKPNHTGATAIERLMRRAKFSGGVMRGRSYILVDDHVTMGSTLNDLRKHIVDHGGKVVATSTLTYSRNSVMLPISEPVLKRLDGIEGISTLLKNAGIANGTQELTEREGQYLSRLADPAGTLRAAANGRAVAQGGGADLRSQDRSGAGAEAVAHKVQNGSERPVAGLAGTPGARSEQPVGGSELGRGTLLQVAQGDFPGFDVYADPGTGEYGPDGTRFAKAAFLRGFISRELNAAIDEALNAPDDLTDEQAERMLRDLNARVLQTPEGRKIHSRYKTGNSYNKTEEETNDPARKAVWDRIHDVIFAPVVDERNNPDAKKMFKSGEAKPYVPEKGREAHIVVGPPAAGKSSVFVVPLSLHHKARVMDSDIIKSLLPGFDGGNGASFVHEESSTLNGMYIAEVMQSGENVVLPIVGSNEKKLRKYIDDFHAAGYKVFLHNNEVPILHAYGRALSRTLSTGRWIAPEVFTGTLNRPTAAFDRVKDTVEGWDEFSNDVTLGEDPVYHGGSEGYVESAYAEKIRPSKPIVMPRDPQMKFDFKRGLEGLERGPVLDAKARQEVFDFGERRSFTTDPRRIARQAVRSDLQERRNKSAEDALVNYVTYFKLAHGSVPTPSSISKLGLAMGMNFVRPKEVAKRSDELAERMRGTLVEKAAGRGDLETAMALIKREGEIDESVDRLIAGGVAAGGTLTHGGVGTINSTIAKRVEQMMRGFTAASLADMEGETGLDIAAEILANDPDAFDGEIKKAKGVDQNASGNPSDDGSADGADATAAGGENLSDYERFKREEARRAALKKVETFIAEAKRRAEENRVKAEQRRKAAEGRSDGGAPGDSADVNPGGGAAADPNAPKNTVAGFKTKEEFAAFMRLWAEDRFKREHGNSTLGRVESSRLFAEFYRITVRKELQDLADKLLAPKGARAHANRRIAEFEKGLRPETIERMSAEVFAFINRAAIRESKSELVRKFKLEIKAGFIKGTQYEDLKLDTDRRVTGWVEEAARYIVRVCDMSRREINGQPSQIARERKELLDILDERARVYDESGKEVASAAKEDMKTKKALWKLALLDKYGAMTSYMPGQILDLRESAISYLENEAAKLEQLWKDTREYEESIRRDLTGAIQGPNGQRYQEKGWLNGRLFDALNGMIRLRLRHLTRFAPDDNRSKAEEAINRIIVMLGDGETVYNRALQDDRRAFYEGLAQIFRTGDGRVDRKAVKAWLNRMTEPIPAALSRQISNQGYAESMTYGQMLQLLVSLEQRSFKDAIAENGREGQAELIRSFETTDANGRRVRVLTEEDSRFIDWLRAYYAAKREVISPVLKRMVGQDVDSPDPLYAPVKRSMDDRTRGLHQDPSNRWDPISAAFSRRVDNLRDFDESASITGMFFSRSAETAGLLAWAERGTVIRGIFTSVGVQSAIRRAFGAGELAKILKQLEATFNGGEAKDRSPGELAAVDKALNFTTYAYLGFNPLSAAKQTTSFTVWANALPGGFRDLWRYMTHFDRKVVRHLMESEEYRVRYGNEIGSGQDMATKGLNENPGMNPVARMLSGAGMWMLKKGDFVPGAWIAQGVYKDRLDKHLQEGMEFDAADRLAITETFNLLEETQQSGRTYNTNMLTLEHGRIGRLLTQFATSALQQLQYETQAYREWRDMKRYNMGEKKIAAAREKLLRAVVINHLMLPAAMNLVTAMFKAAMGGEPPWEKDGWHWTILTELLLGQFSRVFFVGVFAQTALTALFKRETPRAGSMLPVEGSLGIASTVMFTAHDLATLNIDNLRKDIERAIRSTAPTRIPYDIYRRVTGDSDRDRKLRKAADRAR